MRDMHFEVLCLGTSQHVGFTQCVKFAFTQLSIICHVVIATSKVPVLSHQGANWIL
jgi:hypothetical protein